MAQTEIARTQRRHGIAKDDQRNPFQRDRDRILYSSAFRRLGGITQIVRAGEADVFHTRLVHTLKVAQIGRRLAEFLLSSEQRRLAEEYGLSPEVVEAACLAHDLGHPPFGHSAEKTLNKLASKHQESDGFEGNAQSFRVLTNLAARFEDCPGLDLTRATLAATLKYPWLRTKRAGKRHDKWGSYRVDQKDFQFAREGAEKGIRTLEAELMDWADDIAYSVHDVEDFHRCNAIPWHQILGDEGEEKLVEAAASAAGEGDNTHYKSKLKSAHKQLKELITATTNDLVDRRYEATWDQRVQIRLLTSQFITRFFGATKLRANRSVGEEHLDIDKDARFQVAILKQITRNYIIDNNALAAQQRGQGRIIEALFDDFAQELATRKSTFLPPKFSHVHRQCRDGEITTPRGTIDCIASLSEAEAIALHHRWTGQAAGSVLDPIIR